uniref:Uncharacterized protein n=1 Tax=Hyaloperonospora arabidopsidis (strain Emoy2) TaxID=559515 RepID=M4BQF1_HYAAE
MTLVELVWDHRVPPHKHQAFLQIQAVCGASFASGIRHKADLQRDESPASLESTR